MNEQTLEVLKKFDELSLALHKHAVQLSELRSDLKTVEEAHQDKFIRLYGRARMRYVIETRETTIGDLDKVENELFRQLCDSLKN